MSLCTYASLSCTQQLSMGHGLYCCCAKLEANVIRFALGSCQSVNVLHYFAKLGQCCGKSHQ